MKIVCHNCRATNDAQNKACRSCQEELQLNLTSTFQLESGKVLSIVDMLDKVEQLETRLVRVEEHYQPVNKVLKAEKVNVVPAKKVKVAFAVPKTLPTTIEALRGLLIRVNVEKQVAKNRSNTALFADLDFDSKKIEKRIQRLEQEKETETLDIDALKKKVSQSYPETAEGLKSALKELRVKQELANLNRDTKGLEDLQVTETELKRRLKKLELAEMYGKEEEKTENLKFIETVKEKKFFAINKNMIFEIEQDLAATWSAKQRAQITQDTFRFNLLSEKEIGLKEELEMAKRGEIEFRLDEAKLKAIVKKKRNKTFAQPKVEKIVEPTLKATPEVTPDVTPKVTPKVTPEVSPLAIPKIIPKKKPVAVKVIKPKKEGPSAIEEFFAPLVIAVSAVEKKYMEYKKEGKLSLFFLTVAGIVTLLFGFGFLAQYSAVTYLGEYLTQLKVALGFVCSSAAIGIGIRLIKKDRKFAEFGQALMGLGLSLNYLFIYFLSADPPLITSTVGFVLIMLNTAVSIVLSLRYESKIIAVLALLGGALAPSYLQSTGESTHIYFAYLWLLCASSAYTAKRLSWDVLNFVSFVLVILILGRSTYFNYADAQGLPDLMYLILFHAFAYLYAYLSLFDGLKPQKEQNAMNVITLIGAQGVMMMSLYFVYGDQRSAYATLSMAYLLNMIPFALLTVVFYNQWNEQQKSILIGISSAFVAAAIPAYFGVEYRGLLWALQGIMLLSSGLIFKLPIVRRLAYVILLGGLANMFFNLDWSSMPSRLEGGLFTTGYINLWSIGLVLIIVSFLLKKYETVLENHEERVPMVLNEVLSIWALFTFYITTYFFFGRYACNLALIPMFALLVWNNYRKLYLAEILGLLQIAALLLVVILSMEDVNSYHFTVQRLYGQLGIVEILFVLWFLKPFYGRVLPEAPAYKQHLAATTQEAFYIILPLVLLDTFYYVLLGFIGNYAYNLALIPLFALLFWHKYRKSSFTEVLGLLQMLMLVFAVFLSMRDGGSYHFSDQATYGQLAMFEGLFMLWFFKLFYEKVFPEAPAYKHAIAAGTREAFYLVLPLILLSMFKHRFPEYLLYGLWIAVGLAFVLTEFTKKKSILVEFLVLAAIAMILSLGALELGPLIVGNVLLIGITLYKKGWTEEAFKERDYQALYIVLPYFFAVSTGLVYGILFNDDIFSAMQLVAFVLLTMVNLGSKFAPIRASLGIAYRLAWGISFLASIALFASASDGRLLPSYIMVGFVLLAGVLAWSYKMIYKADIPYKGNQDTALWQVESVTVHILTLLSYATLLCWITKDATSLGLTIALFIHGIALVFNGLSPKYTHLKRVYIPLFAVAMIKLFLIDMKDADTVMKIIVFIIVGMSCLLAAYFLIKYNDKNKPVLSPKAEPELKSEPELKPESESESSRDTEEDDSTDTEAIE